MYTWSDDIFLLRATWTLPACHLPAPLQLTVIPCCLSDSPTGAAAPCGQDSVALSDAAQVSNNMSPAHAGVQSLLSSG